MPTAVFVEGDGVGAGPYDQLGGVVDWEGDRPGGALFHAAAFTDDGMRIFDMSESPEAVQTPANPTLS
jgi:hypothetical protein